MTTTIEIRDDQWKDLNALKEPGESFKDVIDRLLAGGPSERRETRESLPQSDRPDGAGETDTDDVADHTVESALDLVDLPGQGKKLERRRAAFRALLEKVAQSAGPTNDLYEPTFDRFDTGYQSVESWRTNAAGDALAQLAEQGVVECADDSAGEWRWLGV
jgi:hypothetical protein